MSLRMMQLKALLKIRALLALREFVKILAGIISPVLMVGIALGMSAAIQSTIPEAPPLPEIVKPTIDASTLADIQKIGLISTLPQKDIISSSIQSILAGYNRSDIVVREFDAVTSFQDSLIKYYQNETANELIPIALEFGQEISTTPGSNNKIKFSYGAAMMENPSQDFNPLLLDLGERLKQILMEQTLFLEFVEILNLYPSDGFYFDVSNTIVPPFLAYGFTFLLPFFAETRVLENEKGYYNYLVTMGTNPYIFYFSSFLVDWAVYMVDLCVAFVVLTAFQFSGFVQVDFFLWFLPIFTYGPTLIALAYMLSFAFKKQETAGMALGFGTAVVVFVPYFFVYFVARNEISMTTVYILSLFLPTFGIYQVFSAIGQSVIDKAPLSWENVGDFEQNPVLLISIIFVLQLLVYIVILGTLIYQVESRHSNFFLALAGFLKSIFSGNRPDSVNPVESDPENPSDSIPSVPPQADIADEAVYGDMVRLGQNNADDVVQVAGVSITYDAVDDSADTKWYQPKKRKILNVIDGLWMSIRKKECFGFLGPNGSGKTSTINMLTGLSRGAKGFARILSHNVLPFYDPQIKSAMGVCLQFDVLWEKLTPKEHLHLFSAIRGLDPADEVQGKKIEDLMRLIELEKFQDKHVGLLSGGNKRKVSLAASAIGEPKIIFLDEPTTGIDVVIRRSIWKVIAELKKSCAIILTTHSMEEAEALSDRIGILAGGKLRCLGTPSRLKSVYGCGFQVTAICHEKGDEFAEEFLDEQPAGMWHLARQVGWQYVFQRTDEGVQEYEKTLRNCATDESKALHGYKELERLFTILERAKKSLRFGEFSFEVTETTLSEVFMSFESKFSNNKKED